MSINELDFVVSSLGECHVQSPMSGVQSIDDDDRVLY
jgi:hypothetical protein